MDTLARALPAAGPVKWRLNTALGPSAAGCWTRFILPRQTRRNWRSDRTRAHLGHPNHLSTHGAECGRALPHHADRVRRAGDLGRGLAVVPGARRAGADRGLGPDAVGQRCGLLPPGAVDDFVP